MTEHLGNYGAASLVSRPHGRECSGQAHQSGVIGSVCVCVCVYV